MYKKKILFTSMMSIFLITSYAQCFENNKEYVLCLPEWKFTNKGYDSEFNTYTVVINKVSDKAFAVTPILNNKFEKWKQSIKDQEINNWQGEITSDNFVKISGLITSGYHYAVMNLNGKFVKGEILNGKAEIHVGMGKPGEIEIPFIYKSEWKLFPKGVEEHKQISSTKVTYHGPKFEPIKATTSIREEQAKRPITSDRGIKHLANDKKREKFYKAMKGGRRKYFTNLLKELSWDEIKYAPGILLLIDHLATLAGTDQKRIAKAYTDDDSIKFFDDISYEEIQRTPPLFLILKCSDEMKKKDLDGLKNESGRFETMFAKYSELPKEDLAELSLSEFVVEVSEQLPEDFRKEYYSQSQKLRDYVFRSKDDGLKNLYSFQGK